jgi:DNA topoisomerase-1
MRLTADRLGNTPAVARRSYVHPAVLEAYVEGEIPRRRAAMPDELADPAEEAEVVALLRRRQRAKKRRPARGWG